MHKTKRATCINIGLIPYQMYKSSARCKLEFLSIMILSRYVVKVFGVDNKLILEGTEWGETSRQAEEKMAEYIKKSTMDIYAKKAPLVIIAEQKS